MKVLKVKSREYKGKQYYKYRINIPEESLKKAGFKEGDELEEESIKGKIELKKKK
jgi:bifunctional DNA-binding transcriptional regulator/antitoxin component of YhaV-PrlF toxin-antitoxin module